MVGAVGTIASSGVADVDSPDDEAAAAGTAAVARVVANVLEAASGRLSANLRP